MQLPSVLQCVLVDTIANLPRYELRFFAATLLQTKIGRVFTTISWRRLAVLPRKIR